MAKENPSEVVVTCRATSLANNNRGQTTIFCLENICSYSRPSSLRNTARSFPLGETDYHRG